MWSPPGRMGRPMDERHPWAEAEKAPGGMIVAQQPEASVFEYTVIADLPDELPLDRIVICQREMPGVGKIHYWGVIVSAAYGDFYAGKVRVLRIAPEVFVPPFPGCRVWFADTENVAWALRFSSMKRRFVIGQMADEGTAYANIDFLSGPRGAHVNIAGIPGVATKTSYALFLLYSLLAVRPEVRAIVFNGKGDDLLHLHKPNCRLPDKDRELYRKLGLPCGPFPEVAYYGLKTGLCTLRQFAERGMMRYLVDDSDGEGALQLAVEHLAECLREAADAFEGPGLILDGEAIQDLSALVKFLEKQVGEKNAWFLNVTLATRRVLLRRLKAGVGQVSQLITEDGAFASNAQVNVVDIHSLSDRGKAFAVAAVLGPIYESREVSDDKRPVTMILLEELQKYAPQQGGGAIKELLLNLAEHGRSRGLILAGAEPTAAQVDERLVNQASLRVVGRLEAAESKQPVYSWLLGTPRRRSMRLSHGTVIVAQPEVPIPLVVNFPFPAWATRSYEVGD